MSTVEAETADVSRSTLFAAVSDAAERDERPPSNALRRALVGVDAFACVAGWTAGLRLTDAVSFDTGDGRYGQGLLVAFLAAITIAAVASQRLYLARVCTVRAFEILRLGRAVGLAMVAALVFPRALPVEVGIDGAVAGGLLALLLLVFGRGLYRTWLQARRRDGRFLRSVVLVGSNDEADDLARLVADHPELGYRVVGFVGPDPTLEGHPLVRRLGGFEDARDAVAAAGARGVIIAATALGARDRNTVVRSLLREGIHVQLTSGVWGIAHRRLLAQPLAHEPLFYVEPVRLARWHTAVKRGIDVCLGVVAAALAAPILAVAAVAVKLQDRGPVLFKQERVGRDGVPFTMYKLRTMVPDAEKLVVELSDLVARDGPSLKLVDDPRRTAVGRFLERTSIDELPQILNVLKGDMSIVGPRPALLADAAMFDSDLRRREEVRPGITGLWQIEARDNPHFSAYRRYDLFYLENWSVGLDLAIILATFQKVVWRSVELIAGRRAEMASAVPLPLSAVD